MRTLPKWCGTSIQPQSSRRAPDAGEPDQPGRFLKPMFTGITTDVGEVVGVRVRGEGLHRLKIACRYDRTSIVERASMPRSGVCRPVVAAVEENARAWVAAGAAAASWRLARV